MDEDTAKIKLRGVEVVFANLDDTGFGKSITIGVTDKAVEKEITDWVVANKIGKGDKAGIPNFKEYEGKKQYAFKINDYTRFAGLNGLTMNNLGFGARISLIASAFEWENKFGKGVSSSLTAVVVEKGANSASDGDLAELLDETGATPIEQSSTEKTGYEQAKEMANKLKTKVDPEYDFPDNDEPINLDQIPF
jgi:hypothetical protein